MSAVHIEAVVCAPAPVPKRTRAGVWFLKFDATLPGPIGQTQRLAPFCVRKEFGSGDAAGAVCRTRARQLQPGVRVKLDANAITSGRIALDNVSDLQLPDLYDHHHKVSP